MLVSKKVCLLTHVPCGKRGRPRQEPNSHHVIIPCRNVWGCRFQLDLSHVPQERRLVEVHDALRV